ncbi:EAL domain-containing protein [Psychrilyobacter atlanticus]|uniref:EAL domain-containing protein n=1 Tax=Psychrilyobacter atlanticus TaxID=271091 RepID=UPI00041977AF|nr:EAL domain-containing protein [Psychrilyobacter atlanticus]
MKFKKFKIKYIYIYLFLFTVIFSFLFYKGNSIYIDEIKKIDDNLYRAAKNLEYLLKEEYNFHGMNKTSYTQEEILETSKKITRLAEINNVDFLYTIIIEDGMPTYTSIGGGYEYHEYIENKNIDKLYWLTFEDVEDDSIDETVEAFNNKDIYYIDSSDDIGSYRSVYLMLTSKDGRRYIAGADTTVPNLKNSIINGLFTLTIYALLISLVLVVSLAIILTNIKKQKKLQKILIKNMNFDKLTGVLKRENGMEQIDEIIKELPLENKKMFLGLFDIMDMTYINEEFGTIVGDNMIKKLTEILKLTFRESDKIVRLSGDQFLVAIIEPLDGQDIKELEKRFDIFLKKYDFEKKRKLHMSVRKVFLEWNNETNLNSMLRVLFEKLRFKKGNDKKEIAIIELDIQRGLRENEFEIYYQPKVNIITHNIEFEALMRWNHKEKGMISPNSFIHIAENSSLIISLTEFLIKQVKKDIQMLKTKVSLNISPNHFNKEFFLEEIMDKYNYLDNIEFELTEENFITNVEESIKKIKILKKLGVNCLIDDFGTGYSSLSSLSTLPITTLKIDRSFVVNMFKTSRDMKIIKTIIELGKSLDLKVVVEGVEEKKEVDFLRGIGVNIFQGYYFGKPERLEVVLDKLKNGTYLINLKDQ